MRGHSTQYDTLPGADVRPPCAIGDPVRFVPSAFTDFGATVSLRHAQELRAAYMLSGTVVYINEAHRYYTVAAVCFGHELRESFKY